MSRVAIDVRHERVLTVIYCKASLSRKSRGILISVLKKQNIRLHSVRYINRSMQTLKKCNDVGHKQRKTFHIYFNCHIYMHDYKRSFCVNICMQKMRVLEYIFFYDFLFILIIYMYTCSINEENVYFHSYIFQDL